jgi:hypothetical protein
MLKDTTMRWNPGIIQTQLEAMSPPSRTCISPRFEEIPIYQNPTQLMVYNPPRQERLSTVLHAAKFVGQQ